MKKLIRMACMALVAIAASVTVVSCSKSDDNEGGSSSNPSALLDTYGFNETILDNCDLKYNYTNANGQTASVDIKKADCEKKDTVIKNETYIYYQWSTIKLINSKELYFAKSLAGGKAYITVTKKADVTLEDDQTYPHFIKHVYCTVTKEGEGIKNGHFHSGEKLTGSQYISKLQTAFTGCTVSYSASSDGTLLLK